MNIQFSSRTDRWYTPLYILERVHRVLGRIDLDPASDAFGNARVMAAYYISEDSLSSPWSSSPATIFLNPPGGKTNNRSNTVLFWDRLMSEVDAGRVRHAIFMCFSIEALQSSQQSVRSIGDYPFCVPSKRIRFDSQDGEYTAPSHSNAIVYVPGTIDKTRDFARAFSDLGIILGKMVF